MLKNQVAEQGMYPVMERLAALDIGAVEVSQIPMDEANTAALERGSKELGIEVGAVSVALTGGPTSTGDNFEDHFGKIVADCKRLGTPVRADRDDGLHRDGVEGGLQAWAAECEQDGAFQAFLNLAQFAEVGQGNMNWPKLLPAAEAAGAEYFFIEQDETYGRDPFDCIAGSRAYLRSIGH